MATHSGFLPIIRFQLTEECRGPTPARPSHTKHLLDQCSHTEEEREHTDYFAQHWNAGEHPQNQQHDERGDDAARALGCAVGGFLGLDAQDTQVTQSGILTQLLPRAQPTTVSCDNASATALVVHKSHRCCTAAKRAGAEGVKTHGDS